MIRFNHITGSLAGTSGEYDKRSIRVGTSGDCDIRYDLDKDPEVGRYHAAIVMKQDAYHILDLGQTGGIWVNGERVQSQALKGGDRVRFGGDGGPEAEVAIVLDPNYDAAKDAQEMVEAFKGQQGTGRARETKALRLVEAAAEKVAEERAKAGGVKSRRTMEVMAVTMHQVGDLMKVQTRKRWVKIVGVVTAVALVIIGGLGVVIYKKQMQINGLLDAKSQFDAQIQAIQLKMDAERDSVRLTQLDRQLQEVTANAVRTLADLAKTDKRKAAEVVAESGDELDREIRAILSQFGRRNLRRTADLQGTARLPHRAVATSRPYRPHHLSPQGEVLAPDHRRVQGAGATRGDGLRRLDRGPSLIPPPRVAPAPVACGR